MARNLRDWLSEVLALERIALRDNPEWQERLCILRRSEPYSPLQGKQPRAGERQHRAGTEAILLPTRYLLPHRPARPPDAAAMPISLPQEIREEAAAALTTYFQEHMDEPLGNLAAGALLDFILVEIGPSIYNQAVAKAQEHLHARVMELDLEVHEDEFPSNRRHPTR